MSKRLILFTNSAELFLSHRQHLARGARDRGYDVYVVCPSSPAISDIEKAGFRVVTVYLGRKSINPFAELRSCVSIWRAFKGIRPAVVHNFTIKCVLYGTWAARFVGCQKIVNTVTGRGHVFLDPGVRAWLIRMFLISVYKITFNSKRVCFVFQNQDDLNLYVENGWVNPSRVNVIAGTGVDVERFRPSDGEPPLPARIIFAGRFLREKGIIELVAACDRLAMRGLEFKLVMCGKTDPGNPSSLGDDYLERLRGRAYVELAGQRSDMEKIYEEGHIVCLPSYGEGLPLALVEAAASGKPIVATNVPGCREVVVTEFNGYLVEKGNITGLGEALEKLICDQDLRRSFGANSRTLALKRFAKAHVVEKGLTLYAEERKVA